MEQKEVKITCPEGYEVDTEQSTFECIVFKPIKKELPKTWEEFCSTHNTQKSEYWFDRYSELHHSKEDGGRNPDYDRNILPSEELAKAMLALCQLIQLRDCYNEGWHPDWSDGSNKYSLYCYGSEIDYTTLSHTRRVMAFKTAELLNEFVRNFQELLEIAKPLL